MEKIEYRVRPVTRYIVTRFHSIDHPAGSESGELVECGEFSNENRAYTVATALAFKEREDLGWPPGDERMQFAQKGIEFVDLPSVADQAREVQHRIKVAQQHGLIGE